MDVLDLQDVVECLADGVGETRSDPAHGLENPQLAAGAAELPRGVLAAAVH